MNKRMLICLLATMVLADAFFSEAQQPITIRSIGFVGGNAPEYAVDAFRQGLRDLGYIEGQSIKIEYRNYDRPSEVPDAVADLARRKVEVIVAVPTRAAVVAQQVTKTIPIVFMSADPLGAGLVDSLAHPGGNATGVRTLTEELGGKRLELLKEVVPRLSRVAIFWNLPAGPGNQPQLRAMEIAARSLQIHVQPVGVEAYDFENVFAAISASRANAFTTVSGTGFDTHRSRITKLAAKHRLPAIYPDTTFAEAGGLMAYGASRTERYRRAAWYVDKILRGAKPADLPVEQPTKFELVVNLKTAKALDLKIPPAVLMDADRVIK
jgi:putative ABC transport system substrate-binding protein